MGIERFGMIDEASGHEPLYFGRTTDLQPHAISGEEYVRHSDHLAALAAKDAEIAALRKQVAELGRERDEKDAIWRETAEQAASNFDNWLNDIARAESAEAALKEAVRDTERFDWLESVNLRSNERNGSVYGWKYDINHNRAALTDHNLPALTIREAIDAARFPERATDIRLSSSKEGERLKAFDAQFPGVRKQARDFLSRHGGQNDPR